jgi:hypothetical protein
MGKIFGTAGHRHQDTIDPAALEMLHNGHLAGVVVVGEVDEDVVAALARHFLYPIDSQCKKVVSNFRNDHTDGLADVAAQAAGVGIGLVVELGGEGAHPVFGGSRYFVAVLKRP